MARAIRLLRSDNYTVHVSICLSRKVLRRSSLFRIWGLYLVALVVNIAMVFGKVGDRIDKNEFSGPNVLKMILCITPLLLL